KGAHRRARPAYGALAIGAGHQPGQRRRRTARTALRAMSIATLARRRCRFRRWRRRRPRARGGRCRHGGPTDTRARTPLVGGLVPVGLRWAWVGLAGSRGADGITCGRSRREELEFVRDDGEGHDDACADTAACRLTSSPGTT